MHQPVYALAAAAPPEEQEGNLFDGHRTSLPRQQTIEMVRNRPAVCQDPFFRDISTTRLATCPQASTGTRLHSCWGNVEKEGCGTTTRLTDFRECTHAFLGANCTK